jgi:uncharacterized membrane protein YhaH (DUF805 family)
MNWLLIPFQRLTDFAGRSRRTEFWVFWLAALVLQMLAGFVDGAQSLEPVAGGMGPLTLAVTLLLLLPAAAVGIRRLHDIGRRGWWMLLFALPYAVWLYMVQTGAQAVIPAIALLIGSVILLVLLVQPGNPGDNAFGPDPKGGIAEGENAG